MKNITWVERENRASLSAFQAHILTNLSPVTRQNFQQTTCKHIFLFYNLLIIMFAYSYNVVRKHWYDKLLMRPPCKPIWPMQCTSLATFFGTSLFLNKIRSASIANAKFSAKSKIKLNTDAISSRCYRSDFQTSSLTRQAKQKLSYPTKPSAFPTITTIEQITRGDLTFREIH